MGHCRNHWKFPLPIHCKSCPKNYHRALADASFLSIAATLAGISLRFLLYLLHLHTRTLIGAIAWTDSLSKEPLQEPLQFLHLIHHNNIHRSWCVSCHKFDFGSIIQNPHWSYHKNPHKHQHKIHGRTFAGVIAKTIADSYCQPVWTIAEGFARVIVTFGF